MRIRIRLPLRELPRTEDVYRVPREDSDGSLGTPNGFLLVGDSILDSLVGRNGAKSFYALPRSYGSWYYSTSLRDFFL